MLLSKITKKECRRIFGIFTLAVLIGLIWNQFYTQGISWRLLQLSFFGGSRERAWKPLSTQDAFGWWIRKEAQFIDIRSEADFRIDHIPAAANIPFQDFFSHSVPAFSSRVIIIYDGAANSYKAPIIVQSFQNSGIDSAFFIRNGFKDWLEFGFPVE